MEQLSRHVGEGASPLGGKGSFVRLRNKARGYGCRRASGSENATPSGRLAASSILPTPHSCRRCTDMPGAEAPAVTPMYS